MAKKKLKMRKVFVLKEVETTLDKIKAGDIFRLEKATPQDTINQSQWNIAEEAATDMGDGNASVQSASVALVRQAGSTHGLFRERA